MELTKLINSINVIQLSGELERKDIAEIHFDSRKVKSNSIFVAIKGYETDGHKFILDAINKNVTAVILDNNSIIPEEIFTHRNVTKILVKDSREALAQASNALYGEPSKKLKVIGITGTKGKTTTSFIIKNILELNNIKTGLFGTIQNYIGSNIITSKMTTPESSEINYYMNQMLSEGCSYCVMEVSSHSLELKRVKNIHFSGAVFTNITSDHLDFHNNFDNYFAAKKILFDELSSTSIAVFNNDDSNGNKIVSDSVANKFSYGFNDSSDFRISELKYDFTGTQYKIHFNNKNYNVTIPLVGTFNAYNSAAAFSILNKMGIEADLIINSLKNINHIPGRFEVISKRNKKIIIDYAHTADSLEQTLKAIIKLKNENEKITTVFGCGGNRDKTKRPVMGKIASELSDNVILTSDNPRNENPISILDDISVGILKGNFIKIENREEAISYSIKNSNDNSIILIAGKGHENYQEINGVRNHFSDREIVEKYL